MALAEGGRWRLFSGEEGDGGRAGREEGGGGLAGLGGLVGLVGLVVSLAGLAGSGLRGEGSVGCGDEMREGGDEMRDRGKLGVVCRVAIRAARHGCSPRQLRQLRLH